VPSSTVVMVPSPSVCGTSGVLQGTRPGYVYDGEPLSKSENASLNSGVQRPHTSAHAYAVQILAMIARAQRDIPEICSANATHIWWESVHRYPGDYVKG
jgi:hypothetical protein